MGETLRSASAAVAPRVAAWRAWGTSIAASLVMVIGAAGCGGSDEPAYCADRAALEESLADLGDVDVRADGVDALTDQLGRVQRDAGALVSSAREELAPEASALRSAMAQLERSVRAAGGDPSVQEVSAVAAAASDLAAAFGDLSDAVGSRC